MEKVLISACLVGENCKYDGKNNFTKAVEQLYDLCDLILVCPETFGGLKSPRQPSEQRDGRVYSKSGRDVTSFFQYGSSLAAYIAEQNQVKYAVLKENSPSCGSTHIYDGSFTGRKIKGEGTATKMLRQKGVIVFNENQIDELVKILKGE